MFMELILSLRRFGVLMAIHLPVFLILECKNF
nr:MAG TPA: hypothetical protein [Caudoviricetes sp.]DAV60188.1 MAG TPA: hypothetical protein [Caudoviricetes sp.]